MPASGSRSRRLLYAALACIAALGWAVVLLFICASPYAMPTASMEPTIRSGDLAFVLKRFAMGSVRRGDLIAFRYPPDPAQTFIKRVIGVPGDRIRIAGKQLYLNGKLVAEPYAQRVTDYTDAYRDFFPASPNMNLVPAAMHMLKEDRRGDSIVVPPGNYFVLGDNRDMSLDSRYWGFVPSANILGRPVFIYYNSKIQKLRGCVLKRVALE
jgi:signal peptidase I